MGQHQFLVRKELIKLLKGGFAPNVILLREFSYDKAGIVLDGLHFSAWILLGHIRARQKVILDHIKAPDAGIDLWPDATWPENYEPKSAGEWEAAIDAYELELEEVIKIVQDNSTLIFNEDHKGNGIFSAVLTLIHHTGYHIGQLKTVGRQVGVW